MQSKPLVTAIGIALYVQVCVKLNISCDKVSSGIWMDRWMDRWTDGWMDGWMNGWKVWWMGGFLDEWMVCQMNECMDGWMDGWCGRSVEGCMC